MYSSKKLSGVNTDEVLLCSRKKSMNQMFLSVFFLIFSCMSFGLAADLASPAAAAEKSVRFIWLIPNDVPQTSAPRHGIRRAALDVQQWYADNNNGRTFRLHEPIVEVIRGDHSRNWYTYTRPEGYPEWTDWYCMENAKREVYRKNNVIEEGSKHKYIIYCSADGRGGGGSHLAFLGQADLDGVQDPTNDARWHGGLAHEMGHALMLPDATETDGSVMSSSFYGFPNCDLRTYRKKLNTDPGNQGYLYRLVNAAN